MGCCSSSLVDQDLLTTSADRFDQSIMPMKAAYYESSKPFKRTGLMWTSDMAMTITELEQKRSAYWESAPEYGVIYTDRPLFILCIDSAFFFNRVE